MSVDQIVGLVLVVLGLLVGALILAAGLARAAGKRPVPTPPAARKVYRCTAGHGPTRCTARATRIVLRVAGPTEAAVMCDDDAFRAARLGHVVDLGPIDRTGR